MKEEDRVGETVLSQEPLPLGLGKYGHASIEDLAVCQAMLQEAGQNLE